MSETEKQRISLVRVNPNSRSLKFLNTKNNIANMTLKKQIAMFEREKTYSMTSLETKRLDTKHFLKQVKALEHDTEESKKYLEKEREEFTPSPQKTRPKRMRRKIRLAQTAPPQENQDENVTQFPRPARKEANSGPETQAEKEKMLNVTKRKSIFLQAGTGRNATQPDLRASDDSPTKFTVPKPNPKTLLDVMIGLNAFNHVQSPSEHYDSCRGDSRMSIDQESFYSNHENVAKKFMLQWKNRVAARKHSILNRLDHSNTSIDLFNSRCDSINLSSVPEGPPTSSHFKRRKSRWSVRQNMMHPTLPAIDDEEERKHQFLAWVQDEREKMRSEKNHMFANISSLDKQAMRRKSFTLWLQKRQEQKPEANDSDDDLGALRDISEDEEDDQPETMGDLIRTILKIKTRFKDSLDSRVKRFNTELELIRKKDEADRKKPMTNIQKRRYKMLLDGLDTTLVDSSDEEDLYYY